jgi:hypothetical protein
MLNAAFCKEPTNLNHIQPISTQMNYFELFNIPVSFDVDLSVLPQTYQKHGASAESVVKRNKSLEAQ